MNNVSLFLELIIFASAHFNCRF